MRDDMLDIIGALSHGWPGKKWSLSNDFKDFDAELEWLEDSPRPTLKEVLEVIPRIQEVSKSRSAYPTLNKQMGMLIDMGVEDFITEMRRVRMNQDKDFLEMLDGI